jgi:hypothetical protein
VVSQKPRLSPVLLSQYRGVVNFKADFHNVYIQVKKDAEGIWYEFPYLVTEQDIFSVISNWSSVWLDPSKEAEGDQARYQ